MRIYSMTATFGKLEHETLTLKPGLNVIHAPNEWGKSTWCAFLVNMLYGIDTRARASGTAIPDKERYAPWSGAAMSGRIDLNWNGRDITIERTSNARTPMGIFRAYETASGLDVPELSSSNCGQMLLGVERSVFSRAGFIRLTDLPVAQDEALRRRLNNLVTTGDESGTADRLGQTLRDLKNKCRSNKANGLIPEAEARRETLRQQLDSLQDLQQRTESLQTRQQELEEQIRQLENHKQALDYAKYLEEAEKLQNARQAAKEAKDRRMALEAEVSQLPEGEEAQLLQLADHLMQEQLRLQAQRDALPQKPEEPEAPSIFAELAPEEALAQVEKDLDRWNGLQKKQKRTGVVICAIVGALTAAGALVALAAPLSYAVAGLGLAVAVIALALGIAGKSKVRKQAQQLQGKYPGKAPDTWLAEAQTYARESTAYWQSLQNYTDRERNLAQKEDDLHKRIREFAGQMPIAQKRQQLEQAQHLRADLEKADKEVYRAEEFAKTLEEMTQPVQPPQAQDMLNYSYRQTVDILDSAKFEQRQVQLKLAECDGQRQIQGHEAQLRSELEKEKQRILRLEAYYDAIEMAQSALSKAGAALQRRFAPKISKRTQELFQAMTGDRYQRVVMAEDMRLSIAAADEDTLRDAQRRSDGTVDQLYLALRLAVAEELTPGAPVVLDDALVRFDDDRLAAAMKILAQEAKGRQVILFTCQQREADWEKNTQKE
ncbi:MAG: AAA family ATPase [Oscillospiraceae bacterium]|nr:AAA family ATPase [Oscillospiraceae bacterium]